MSDAPGQPDVGGLPSGEVGRQLPFEVGQARAAEALQGPTMTLLVPVDDPRAWALANMICSAGALTRYWATLRSEADRSSHRSRPRARSLGSNGPRNTRVLWELRGPWALTVMPPGAALPDTPYKHGTAGARWLTQRTTDPGGGQSWRHVRRLKRKTRKKL